MTWRLETRPLVFYVVPGLETSLIQLKLKFGTQVIFSASDPDAICQAIKQNLGELCT